MKMKKVLLTGLSFVLVAAVAIGGTLAYLTSTDDDVNVMTLGNVSIAQHEYQRVVNADGTYATATIDNQTSYVLEDFKQAKPLLPIVGDPSLPGDNPEYAGWDSTIVRMTQVDSYGYMQVFAGKNAQDKFVTVENTGKTDAYVRTLVAIECGTGDANLIGTSTRCVKAENAATNTAPWISNYIGKITIDANTYVLYEYIYRGANDVNRHVNGVLPAGDTTYPNLAQVYLKSETTNEDCEALDGNGNGTLDILVLSQAVQADGFTDATTALNEGFGVTNEQNVIAWFGNMAVPTLITDENSLRTAMNEGNDVLLGKDLEDVAVETIAPYSNYYGLKQSGNTLDGNGKTLDFDLGLMKGGKFDNYGIMTSGGTIKNVTISGVFRGIMIMNPTEDLYVDNVTIGGDEDMCYGINTGEGNGQYNVYISNSKISGWNSFGDAVNEVYFTNCTFGQGTYYNNVYGRLVKPYRTAVFENCEFGNKYYIDLSALKAGETITLKNCTVNGVKLTASNWKTLIASENDCMDGQISVELRDGSYLTASNIVDYVIFE